MAQLKRNVRLPELIEARDGLVVAGCRRSWNRRQSFAYRAN